MGMDIRNSTFGFQIQGWNLVSVICSEMINSYNVKYKKSDLYKFLFALSSFIDNMIKVV